MSELEVAREEVTRAREEVRALEDSRAALESSLAALEGLRREVEELRRAHDKAAMDREQYRALYMQVLERCRMLERGILAGKKAERFAGEDANHFCLLPSWPRNRVLELAPASWKQTLEQEETQQRLATNVFRQVSLTGHADRV